MEISKHPEILGERSMRKQCVPGSFFSTHTREPGNEAKHLYICPHYSWGSGEETDRVLDSNKVPPHSLPHLHTRTHSPIRPWQLRQNHLGGHFYSLQEQGSHLARWGLLKRWSPQQHLPVLWEQETAFTLTLPPTAPWPNHDLTKVCTVVAASISCAW